MLFRSPVKPGEDFVLEAGGDFFLGGTVTESFKLEHRFSAVFIGHTALHLFGDAFLVGLANPLESKVAIDPLRDDRLGD